MSGALAILLAAVGTYGLRALFVTVVPNPNFPAAVDRALASAGIAVMAALAAVHLSHQPSAGSPGTAARLVAVGVASLVAHRTRRLGPSMAAAMAALWAVHVLAA